MIFLTNDGNIVNKILRSKNSHEKEYVVTVNKNITPDFIAKMSNGIPILNTITDKCKVKRINDNAFNIVLKQGLNRQIRRMCEYLGYGVTSLQRTRIINITLGNLKVGEYRSFTTEEFNELQLLLKDSSKTHEG